MSLALDFGPEFAAVDAPARASVPARVPGRVPRRSSGPERPERLASVTVLRPPAEPAAAAPLRLTRRGVLVLSTAVALLGLAVICWAHASLRAAGASPGSSGSPAGVVTVQSGDTLWSIATRVAPGSDPRAEVDALQRRNHLAGVGLVPGQQLRVP